MTVVKQKKSHVINCTIIGCSQKYGGIGNQFSLKRRINLTYT